MLKNEQYTNCDQNLPSRKFSTYVSESYAISKLGILAAMFSSHFFVMCLILSYTPMIATKINEPVLWEFITITVFFCAFWTLFDPLTRKIAEYWESTYSNRNIAIIGIFMLFTSIFTQIFSIPILIKFITFGFIGGLSASLILSQIEFVSSETILNDFDKLKKIPVYSQSIAVCVFPSILEFLKTTYGNKMSNLILAGIAIQLLPLILFLRTIGLPNSNSAIKYNIYKNEPQIFQRDVSTIAHRHFKPKFKSNIQPKTSSTISTLDNSDDEEISHYVYKKSKSYKNKNIASIHNLKTKNFLNTISGKMDDEFNKSQDEFIQDMKTNSLLDESTNKKPSMDQRQRNLCCWFISSYKLIKTKGKFVGLKKIITEKIIHPVRITLKLWQFYPALFLKTSYLCMLSNVTNIFVFLLQTPLEFTKYDILFFLLIQGISWLCFLLSTSCYQSIMSIKKSHMKLISSAGCCLEVVGLLVTIYTSNNVCLVLGAVLMGIANAIISSTYSDTCKSLIGSKNWIKSRSCLDIFSALLLLLLAVWLSINIAYKIWLIPYLCFLCFIFLMSSLLLIIDLIVMATKNRGEFQIAPQCPTGC